EVVGIELQLVARLDARVLVDVERQRGDGTVEGETPVLVRSGVTVKRDQRHLRKRVGSIMPNARGVSHYFPPCARADSRATPADSRATPADSRVTPADSRATQAALRATQAALRATQAQRCSQPGITRAACSALCSCAELPGSSGPCRGFRVKTGVLAGPRCAWLTPKAPVVEGRRGRRPPH